MATSLHTTQHFRPGVDALVTCACDHYAILAHVYILADGHWGPMEGAARNYPSPPSLGSSGEKSLSDIRGRPSLHYGLPVAKGRCWRQPQGHLTLGCSENI